MPHIWIMKQIIIISALVFILVIGVKGISYAKGLMKKGEDAKKLEYQLFKTSTPDLTLDEIALILDGKNNTPVAIQIIEQVINPSQSTFTLDQVKLNLYSKAGKLIVQQKKPLKNPFVIKKRFKGNYLTSTFLIHPDGLKALIQEAGGLIQVGQNKLLTGKWGISFRMKGTISTEGFDLPLDELTTI